MLTRTDKPLPVIVFTLATNNTERIENVHAHCKVLYLQKQGIEPVADDVTVEVVALKLMGCRFDPQRYQVIFIFFFNFSLTISDTDHLWRC